MRKVLAALGVFAALAGFAMLVDPGLAATLTTSEKVLIPIGVLLVVQGYRVVRGRMRTRIELAETGDPETEQDLPIPGEDFDETLAGLGTVGRNSGSGYSARRNHVLRNRDRIKSRLEDAAVATVKNKWGCPEDRARRAIEEGTWTDDPHAAAFFTGEIEDVTIRERIYYAFASEPRFQRRANHAAEAIADLSAADAEAVRQEVSAR